EAGRRCWRQTHARASEPRTSDVSVYLPGRAVQSFRRSLARVDNTLPCRVARGRALAGHSKLRGSDATDAQLNVDAVEQRSRESREIASPVAGSAGAFTVASPVVSAWARVCCEHQLEATGER